MRGGKTKAESKPSTKRKATEKGTSRAAKKAAKDPNMPKRPPSAFFVFLEEFRKQFKEKNPNNKSIAAVGKACGAEWKSLTEAEKAPYVAKAEKRKADYTKQMDAYNNKMAGGSSSAGDDDGGSDKSKSEVHDGEDDDSAEEDEDDD